ncbi:pectate lyase [Vibrio mangrovi]|uniref:Pectate lyase n=1 Tax=Vibrio mangrovi TaxID=474394 RepID=A0A1Y6J1E4_9VIBR|nr:pectate lyase [Vibrio mangrovi]MDW6001931.1 pectate lyase [Vibrio mangrovi]SMS02522.1 Pectate lyase C precursor [Vibrio mangrovi]
MISINLRMPQTNDWMQNAPPSGQSDTQNRPENRSLSPGAAQGQQDSPAMQLFNMLIQALLQMAQDGAGKDGAGAQDPFKTSGGSNDAMQGLGNQMLNSAMNPTSNGGGQLSPSTSPLNREVGKMMDNNPGAFGNPQAPAAGAPAGNPSAAAPVAAGASPAVGSPSGTGTSGSSGTGASSVNMFPTADSKNAVVIDEPIVVKAGETFDGKGKTFTASSKLGDGGQSEDQKPLFVLEDGASLKNVVLGDNEADGIHTHGDAKLDNVHWTDVGEDALTMKKGGTVEISNSSAKNADDKIFQLNDDGKLILNNVQADNFGKLVRTNGGQQGNWDIQLNDVTATNGKHALVQSDSNTVSVSGNNVNTENVKGMYILPDSGKLNIS